jgi:hypothetical protein
MKLRIDRATVVLEAEREREIVKLAFEKLRAANPQVSLILKWE